MNTSLSRPHRGKYANHALGPDQRPLCGVRKGGDWQLEMWPHVSCLRCKKLLAAKTGK